MSVSKTHLNDPEIREQVVQTYLSENRPTLYDTAARVGITFHTAQAIIKDALDPETRRHEKSLRYSRSKAKENNPWWGKQGAQSPRHKPTPSEGKNGYLTVPRPFWMTSHQTQKRVPEHQVVACQMLDTTELPRGLHVHHIDEDVTNNDPSNLAVVTNAGHRRIHARSPLRKYTLWELHRSGTSK